ncbi:MAG: hypothetical protein QNJ44_09770 [Rhodobacter sp.]|nr:hypothetical protein [Rhodobacter sp.]
MSKYGPTRKEHIFRLCFSLFGLSLMLVALLYRGIPTGPALFEVGVMGGLFFSGSAIWSASKLIKGQR